MTSSNTAARLKTPRLEEDGSCYQTSGHLQRNLEVYDSGVSLSIRDDIISCQSGDERHLSNEIRSSQSRCQSLAYDSGFAADLEHCESQLISMDIVEETKETCERVKISAVPTEVLRVPVNGIAPVPEVLQELFNQDEDGDTKLHLAIIQPDVEAAKWMIAASAPCRPTPLNLQNDRFRQTPLHLAVATNQPQLVRMLVACGTLLETRDHNGYTPLQFACARGNLDCIKAITVPVAIEDYRQLMCYCRNVNLPCFAPPSYHRPNLNNTDYEGCSCLHLVQKLSQPNRLELFDYLVKNGADVNIKDGKSGQSVLHLAVKQRDIELVEYLCNCAELDINGTSYGQQTALDVARHLQYDDVVELLQRHGACHSDLFVQQDEETITDSSDNDSEDAMDDYDDLVICGQPLNCR